MFSLENPINPVIAEVPCSWPVWLVIKDQSIDFEEIDDIYFKSLNFENLKKLELANYRNSSP